MSDDLVKRLRNPIGTSGSDFNATYWLGISSEAADHIEALNAALEAYATETMERIDELEAALEKIIKTPPFGQPQMIARAALGEKKDD
jgi:cell division septum initiation protein DivIVA